MNNKEWLYSLDPHALTEWFESEHFECPTDGGEASMMCVDAFIAEHVSQSDTANQSNVSGNSSDDFTDSREKLEADAWNISRPYQPTKQDADAHLKDILELLDRQAAITEAKVERKWSCYEGSVQAEIDRLNAKIDELQAENYAIAYAHGAVVERLDAMNEGELLERINEYERYEAEMDCVLSRLTNGKWSKSRSYTVDFIVSCVNEELEELYCSDIDDLRADRDKLVDETHRWKAKVDDLAEERDYWKWQLSKCLARACIKSGYTSKLMAYPRPDDCIEPSLIVADVIENLETFYAESKADAERWREGYGQVLDKVHELDGIVRGLEGR